MAKPNYSFEKRQRELAKKKKKEEKAQRKTMPGAAPGDDAEPGGDNDGVAEPGALGLPETPAKATAKAPDSPPKA